MKPELEQLEARNLLSHLTPLMGAPAVNAAGERFVLARDDTDGVWVQRFHNERIQAAQSPWYAGNPGLNLNGYYVDTPVLDGEAFVVQGPVDSLDLKSLPNQDLIVTVQRGALVDAVLSHDGGVTFGPPSRYLDVQAAQSAPLSPDPAPLPLNGFTSISPDVVASVRLGGLPDRYTVTAVVLDPSGELIAAEAVTQDFVSISVYLVTVPAALKRPPYLWVSMGSWWQL